MKTYEEKTNCVFTRIEEEKEIRRVRKKRITKGAVPALSLCLMAALGFSVWQTGILQKTPDSTVAGGPDGGAYVSDLGKNAYGEEEKSDDMGEWRGMIIKDDIHYLQIFETTEAYSKGAYLGMASDFEGNYKYYDGPDGALYESAEDKNVLMLFLDNGETVVLHAEFPPDGETPSQVQDAPADTGGAIYREQTAYPDDIMDLQRRISADMTAGKLPFVTSSSIVENPLRLEICVNTQDSKLIERVKDYDPNGKYISIVQSNAGVEE